MSVQIADLNETVQNQLKRMKSDDRLTILNISNNGTINLSDLPYYRSSNHIIVFINPTDQEITTVETSSKPEVKHASRVRKQVELFTHLSASSDQNIQSPPKPKTKANHRLSVKKDLIKDDFMNECLPTLTKAIGKQLKTVYTSMDGFEAIKMHQAIDKQPCVFAFKTKSRIIGSYHNIIPNVNKFTSDPQHFVFLIKGVGSCDIFKIKKKMPILKIGKDLVDTNCAFTVTLNGMISINACMDRYYSDMNVLPSELIGSVYPNKESVECFAVFVTE
ncbi:TLDc domain-containing protein [Entamoeba marina]